MQHLRPRAITSADATLLRLTPPPAPNEDSYLAKLIKYIPGESIATYQAMAGLVPNQMLQYKHIVTSIAVFICVLTPIWMYFATKRPSEPPQWFQVGVSPLAFLVWLFAIGSPLYHHHDDWVGSIVLIAVSALIPLLEKIFIR